MGRLSRHLPTRPNDCLNNPFSVIARYSMGHSLSVSVGEEVMCVEPQATTPPAPEITKLMLAKILKIFFERKQ